MKHHKEIIFIFILTVISRITINGEIVQLRGAGASFPAEVYKNWMPAYSASRQQHKTINLTYLSVGSGRGQAMIKQNVDLEYSGSDSLLKASDQNLYPDLVMAPVMAGAVVIAYNLPQLNGHLHLTREQVVGIYNGTIPYWNDTTIKENNPSLTLPNETIVVIARGDKSGTTNLFTKALSAFDKNWESEYGEFSEGYDYENHRPFHWKENVITYYGQQNRGSSGLLLSFDNSVGYLSLADAVEAHLHFARIQNKAGLFVPASYTAVQEAMNYHSQFSNTVTFDLIDGASSMSYPISGFTYIIFYKSKMSDCESAKELVRYIDWIYTQDIADNICRLLGFSPLSDTVSERVKSSILKKVTCNGLNVWDLVAQDKINENAKDETEKWIIPVSVTGPVLGIAIIAMMAYILLQRIKLKKRIDNNEWSIDIEDVTFYYDSKINSEKSYQTMAWSCRSLRPIDDIKDGNEVVCQILQWPGKWKGHVVGLSLIKISNFKIVTWETKRTLLQIRDSIIHSNVQRFFGLTELESDRYVIGEYCSKGSLQKVLHDGRYNLTKDFKASIASDITNGMNFLHSQGIVHGILNSNCCLIDSRWTVKISSWEYFKIFKTQEPIKNPYERLQNLTKDKTSVFDKFWVAPEILKAEFRIEPTQAADVYSYAIVLQEIFTRQLPYSEYSDVSTTEDVVKAIVNNHLRPQLGMDIPVTMRQIMDIAWSDNCYSRPSFEQITKMLKSSVSARKSVLDSMIDAMDEYTHHLEDRIEEKSSELNLVKKKLISQHTGFIPKSYLKRMADSEYIPPEDHLFLGIVSIELVEAKSIKERYSASEIFTLFNQYYTEIDNLCIMFGGYKMCGSDLGVDIIVFGFEQKTKTQSVLQMGHFCVDVHVAIRNNMSSDLLSSMQRLTLKVAGHAGVCKTGIIASKTKQFFVTGTSVHTSHSLLSKCENHGIVVSKTVADIMDASQAFILTDVEIKGDNGEQLYRLLGKTGINIIETTSSEDEESTTAPGYQRLDQADDNSAHEMLTSSDYQMIGSSSESKEGVPRSSKLAIPKRKPPPSNKVNPL